MANVVMEIKEPKGPFTHLFYCEACEYHHGFNAYLPTGPLWGFNNDLEKPTLEGSILVRSGNADGPTICHSFIRDGQIEYLTDCTHKLAGKTVPLTDVDL